ncbi:hypothetical protein H072_479 [Dactylellina haptotyla CBS 200.50]|uniref:F-box domain-containing protein n=1 Tax=Dactylellina haptotyla (strain CBS 200.50) TaxID=1284197 RepID=S8ARE2_DACHA|nr:hypothetical protein H072_479 [Dactylellina haptotyla CBS 200.50]
MATAFFSSWSATSLNATATIFRALPVNAQMGILSTALARNETLNANSEAILNVLRALPSDVQGEVLSHLTNCTAQLSNCQNTFDAIGCVLENLPASTQAKVLANLPIVKQHFQTETISPEVQEEILANLNTLREQLADCKTNSELIASILGSLPTEMQARILSNLPTIKEQLSLSTLSVELQEEITSSLYNLKDKLVSNPERSVAIGLKSKDLVDAESPLPLPAEIQIQILGHLPTLKEQLSASQVCKYWRQLVLFCKQTRAARYVQVSDTFEVHSLVGQPGICLGCHAKDGMVIQYLSANIPGTETPWADISEYSFIDEPLFAPLGQAGVEESDISSGIRQIVFTVKFMLDHEDSLLPLGQIPFQIERTTTIKTFIDTITVKVQALLTDRNVVSDVPHRISLRKTHGTLGDVTLVASIATNPKPGDRPGLPQFVAQDGKWKKGWVSPTRVPARLRAISEGPPKRKLPNLSAAEFFRQLEANSLNDGRQLRPM